jgi:hypothetical protein
VLVRFWIWTPILLDRGLAHTVTDSHNIWWCFCFFNSGSFLWEFYSFLCLQIFENSFCIFETLFKYFLFPSSPTLRALSSRNVDWHLFEFLLFVLWNHLSFLIKLFEYDSYNLSDEWSSHEMGSAFRCTKFLWTVFGVLVRFWIWTPILLDRGLAHTVTDSHNIWWCFCFCNSGSFLWEF